MRMLSALAAVALTVIAGSALAAPATYKGHELAGKAKVSIGRARAIALMARPGKITDQELEAEFGGTGLRYSFDVKAQKAIYEVGVDAVTGKVLENKKEGLHPD